MRAILLILVLTVSGIAAELTLDTATVAGNNSPKLSLRLDSGGSELTGIQFDIEYDASRFDVRLEIGPAAEDAVKVLQSNTLLPGKQRVLIFGFNRNKFGDGVVAFANVTLKGTPDPGQTWPIRILDPVGTSAQGEGVPVKGISGSVKTAGGTHSPARSNAR